MLQKTLVYILLSLTIKIAIAYQLGNNLLKNSQFSAPVISGGIQYFNKSIPSWECTNFCQVNSCILYPLNCTGQALDLTSDYIENVTQVFQAQAGNHRFDISYLIPPYLANQKILLIYLNDREIYRFYPQVTNDNLVYQSSINVYLLEGTNVLTLTMGGLNDCHGFKIVSVSMARIINSDEQSIILGVVNNNIIEAIISFPSSRVLLGEIANIFISFDRLQLYYYHGRSFSYYTTIFLSRISNLLDYKGRLSLTLQQKLFGEQIQKEKDAIDGLDFKYQYIGVRGINKSPNGYGFVANNSNLVVYSIPFILVISLLLNSLFKASSKWKFSRVLRKYSYLGTIILTMICEGNIQQYSFYIFGQFTTFFSQNFTHKMVNIAISLFFFVVLFSSLGLYLWFWSQQKTKVWCMVENIRLCFGGMIAYVINRGAVCLLFGAIHQLLLPYPNIQLLSLGLCEILWIIAQVTGLAWQIYQCALLVWLNVIEGFLRMGLQLTLYLYANAADRADATHSSFINEHVHLCQIFLFFAVWAIEIIVSLVLLIVESWSSKNSKNKKNKQYKKIKKNIQSKRKCKKTVNFYLVLKKGKITKFFSKYQNQK